MPLPNCYLELLDKLQNQICRIVGPSLFVFLEPLVHHHNVAKVFSIDIILVDVHLKWLNWFHFLILEVGLLIILIDCIIFLSPSLNVTDVYVNSFFPRTGRLLNILPIDRFPLTYNLNSFMSRIYGHLLTVGSF